MEERNNVEISDFLILFHQHMQQAIHAYKQYLTNGKQFLHAKELRRINSSTILLLEENQHLLPLDLQAASAALLEHYHIWRNKWDATAIDQQPIDTAMFAFENAHTFPKHAAEAMEKAYQQIIKTGE
jgi:hypothetical protein